MATRGGFASWTERAKDVIVQELRSYVSLEYKHVLREMPQIERYGLAGETSSESFLSIFTTRPLKPQRLPFLAVMSAPGSERKMGIGRQVIKTFHHPVTGRPTIREVVGGDMSVVIEIAAIDTNTRSELTDIVFSFFTVYLEDKNFTILGNTEVDEVSGVPNYYQIIIKNQASLAGETDMPRPEGEPVSRIYMNRITVPIVYLDYVDREGSDITVCYNPNIEPEFVELPPIPEPREQYTVLFDDFEDGGDTISNNWVTFQSVDVSSHLTLIDSIQSKSLLVQTDTNPRGLQHAFFLSNFDEFSTSGRLIVNFRILGPSTRLILSCMVQDVTRPLESGYHFVFPNSEEDLIRVALYKGSVFDDRNIVNYGSQFKLYPDLTLGAAIEWKYDKKYNRTRLRAYVTKCGSRYFGELVKRFEFVDSDSPLSQNNGQGFGFLSENGKLYIDNVHMVNEFFS